MSTTPSPLSPSLQPPKSTQPMISPEGIHGDIPVDKVQDAIKAGFKPGLEMTSPDGIVGVVPIDRAGDALKSGFKVQTGKMQSSQLPSMVRNTGYALPAIGGSLGAIFGGSAGAAAGGVPAFAGAPAGAAVGADIGEQLRMAAMNKIFGNGDEPSPASWQGQKQAGMVGAVNGAMEIPSGLLQGMGTVWTKQLAAAKSAKQVGDVLDAIDRQSPIAFSKGGYIKKLADINEGLSSQISGKLAAASKNTIDLDSLLAPIRAEARIADMSVPGVEKNIESTIEAAKYSAGYKGGPLKGDIANPQQLANLQNYLRDVKRVYTSNVSANVSATSQDILMKADQALRNSIRTLAPGVGDMYDQMSDVHAALSAVKNYSPGLIKSAAITAASHPKTTAAIGPLIAPGLIAGEAAIGKQVKSTVGRIAGSL